MNDYNKNSFYTYIDECTETRKYFIKVGNQKIEISKSVYLVCHSSYQKQLRDMRLDIKNGLISYDMQLNNESSLLDKISNDLNSLSVEDNFNFFLMKYYKI